MSAKSAVLSVGGFMNRPTATPLFIASIIVFPTAVKSRAADLPNVSPASRKTDLKDSVKDNAEKDLAQLIDFMMKNSQDGKIGENAALVMGLPGSTAAKGQNIRSKINGKERGGLNCMVVYEKTTDTSVPEGKKPTCVYLMRVTESPRFKDFQHFRINLNGKLEKVVTSRVKKDADGAIIPGSSVDLDDDLDSAAVRKTYAAEMREIKAWLKVQLKTQKKLDAKKATASAAKSGAVATANASAASTQSSP